VEHASTMALAALDAGFFRVRFDRLTPSEKRYLHTMAELGPGPHRSGAHHRCARAEGHFAGADPRATDCKGDDLEPEPRRHGVRGAPGRRLHAPYHAGLRLAGGTSMTIGSL